MTNSEQSERAARLTVDLDALRSNYRTLSARAAPARCAGVVKADGYGVGAVHVAQALAAEGCRDFFVAHLDEAAALLPQLPGDATLSILNGLIAGSEARCAQLGAVPVLNTVAQARAWQRTAQALGRPLAAALQVDSGMSRLGMSLSEASELAQDATFRDQVDVGLLLTHLACADEPDHPANRAQLAKFDSLRDAFPGVRSSIANSAGVFLGADFRHDLVRPGIALFGAPPSPLAEPLAQVVRLEARVIQSRWIEAGAGVGYGLDYVAEGRRRVATLGVGYADGWLRSLGGKGAAWLNGRRLPILGRVSMDCMSVDVTDVAEAMLGEGDFVDLIGPAHTLADVANDAGTIPYEILTRLGQRFERVYAGSDALTAPAGRHE